MLKKKNTELETGSLNKPILCIMGFLSLYQYEFSALIMYIYV